MLLCLYFLLTSFVHLSRARSNGTKMVCGTLEPAHGPNFGTTDNYRLVFTRLNSGVEEMPQSDARYSVKILPENYLGFSLLADQVLNRYAPCAVGECPGLNFIRHRYTGCKASFEYHVASSGVIQLNYTVVTARSNYQMCGLSMTPSTTPRSPVIQCTPEAVPPSTTTTATTVPSTTMATVATSTDTQTTTSTAVSTEVTTDVRTNTPTQPSNVVSPRIVFTADPVTITSRPIWTFRPWIIGGFRKHGHGHGRKHGRRSKGHRREGGKINRRF